MRLILPFLFLATASSAAFGACSNTSYGHGATCIHAAGAGAGTSVTQVNVNISPTAGHQMEVRGYWCKAGTSCLTLPTETVVISTNLTSPAAEPCFQKSPSSPMYLQETGAQKIGNYVWACNSIPSGVTAIYLNASASVDFLTVIAEDWTGLATTQPMIDDDGGCFSTAATQSFTCNSAQGAQCTNDLMTGYITTINDLTVTYTTPASSLQIINFGGTAGGLTVAATGVQTMAGNWTGQGNDSFTGMIAAVKTQQSVCAGAPRNQFPRAQ